MRLLDVYLFFSLKYITKYPATLTLTPCTSNLLLVRVTIKIKPNENRDKRIIKWRNFI